MVRLLAAGGVVLVGQWAVVDSPIGWVQRGAVGIVSLGVLAVAGGLAAARDDRFGLAALLVACSPTVVTAVAAGERHGLVAAVLIAGAVVVAGVETGRGVALTASAAATLLALASWWGAGVSRGAAPGPGWNAIVGSTGDVVRAGFGVVGPAGLAVPASGVLLWWCLVGVVVGAAALGDRPVVALAVPGSMVAFVAVAWAITHWRGPVDAAGGTWAVVAALALTGSLARVPAGFADRVARLLAVGVGATWAIALVRLARETGAAPAAVVLVGASAASVGWALWAARAGSIRASGGGRARVLAVTTGTRRRAATEPRR